MNKIVEVDSVVKHYKRGSETIPAIDGVSLSADAGEFLSILGPSGSGKSTLLHLIGCVDKPTSGSIRINGTEIVDLGENQLSAIRSATIGFVFQQFFLIPTLSALENVMLPTLFSGRGPHHSAQRAAELLIRLGLGHRGDHRPVELSGGEMQRLAIARALINEPQLLLADEPTGNLDSHSIDATAKIFSELTESGLTIIMVTHNPELAELSERCLYIEDGKISGNEPD